MVHNLVRRVATVMISLVAVVALSIPGVNYALASTVLMMGGTTFPTLSDETMAAVLNGRYANDTRVNVEWPAQMWPQTGLTSLTLGESVAIGIENLQDAVPTASRPTVVLGMSGSAPVVDEVQRRLAADPNAPKSDQLSFVTLADPNRGHGILTLFRNVPVPILNYTPTPEPVTQYNNLVVVKEYDGYADFPDRPWNLLATLNAIVGMGIIPGFGSMHYDTIFSDLATVPKENITTTVNAKGGVTTTYLVPSPDLPLLQPLRDWGVPKEFVDAINTPLKTLVDFGYSRNDDKLFGVKPATNVVTDSVRFAPSSADAKTASDSDTATFGSRKPLTNVVTESVKFAPGSADDRNATAARSSGSVTSSDGKPATDVVTESPNFNSVSGPKSAGAEGRTAAGSSSAESPEQQSVSASASP